jgi:hypothetical protein
MGMNAWRVILILLSVLPAWDRRRTGHGEPRPSGHADGRGLGVALLWPWSNYRFFAPWRPIPVAPIGAALFSARGLEVMLTEAVQFLPLFIVGLWPRRAA